LVVEQMAGIADVLDEGLEQGLREDELLHVGDVDRLRALRPEGAVRRIDTTGEDELAPTAIAVLSALFDCATTGP
jgi:hypothetical protein